MSSEKKGLKTSDLYGTSNLPTRFNTPDNWHYSVKRQHPLYTTTANLYGQTPPSVHEMPKTFHGQSAKFTELLSGAGPTRNYGLNH
ncbi:hypothetical protein BC829DRAFT_372974 [Chytridium lagenaria]|nr:hypothetical protein BC829DRAFT_372974 [Chytridium lagenaria]